MYTLVFNKAPNYNLLYKAEKPYVCLSVVSIFWHGDNSAGPASIKTGLGRNESCAFKDYRVYFYKPTELTICQQEWVENEDISTH